MMRKAIIRRTEHTTVIICNLGHLLERYIHDRNYGGSMIEAELAFRHDGDRFDRLASRCKGAGH